MPTLLFELQDNWGVNFPDHVWDWKALDHWQRENDAMEWPKDTLEFLLMFYREQNYNSHSWHWVRDPGSPYQSPEHTRVCKDCGLEDMGHPDEFDIEYPNCAEMGD